MRERVAFEGIDGRGWYSRTDRAGRKFLTRAKVFYDLEAL